MHIQCQKIKWKQYSITIGLGQLLSVLISGTGICSQLLALKYNVNIPTTQSFLNYLLLISYLIYNIVKSRRSSSNSEHPFNFRDLFWSKKTIFYFLLSIADVEANFVVVLAYQYTTITSVMLLDCFSIPCVMILSWVFLKTRYKMKQYLGVFCCLIGLGVLVTSDYFYNRKDNESASNPILGDFLCLLAASLYSISNIGQEYIIRKHPRTEWLGMIGLFGSFICGLQVFIVEYKRIIVLNWSAPIGGLIVGFALCLFLMYSFTPLMLHVSSATLFNLSLLTSDVFAIIAGVFLFQHKPTIWYFVSFFAIIVGLVLYNFGASEKETVYNHVPENMEEEVPS